MFEIADMVLAHHGDRLGLQHLVAVAVALVRIIWQNLM